MATSGDKAGLSGDKLRLSGDKAAVSGDKLFPSGDNAPKPGDKLYSHLTALIAPEKGIAYMEECSIT